MIEVEKKFKLDKIQQDALLAGARFLNKKIFTDIYYDTSDFYLMKQDIWLRDRAGNFELKIAYNTNIDDFNQYREIMDEEEIKKFLKFELPKSMAENLRVRGFGQVCVCATTRSKFQKGEFIIDLDEVNFPEKDHLYFIGEIELLVENEKQIGPARTKIGSFARQHNLDLLPVRGKVLEYLKLFEPEIYDTLKRAWSKKP